MLRLGWVQDSHPKYLPLTGGRDRQSFCWAVLPVLLMLEIEFRCQHNLSCLVYVLTVALSEHGHV